MKNVDELFDNAIAHWREKRCIGSCIIPPPVNDKCIILQILQRIYIKYNNANVLITTRDFKERTDLIEFITNQEDEENNQEFKNLINNKYLKFWTVDFIERNCSNMTPYVCIVYHLDIMSKHLEELLLRTNFKIVILNKLMKSSEDMNKLYSMCPLLDDFKQNEIDEIRTSTPVEEEWVGLSIDENTEEYKLLQYYNEYIITSLRTFGSFDNIQEARIGNVQLNISSSQICNQIAYDNGWNEHLDMSIELNVQLDALYNPINIRDRATQTYELIRERSKLLSDYKEKLNKILEIVEKHKNEKILIINKRGEFANIVTKYLNEHSEDRICGNYHDNIEPIPAVDINGNPVLYKSGEQKGKRKMMCTQAQKTQNEQLFNLNRINVLSTNSAPDKNLNINVDVIIITSPQCEDIKSYMYRLNNVYYPSGKIKLYSIYIKNSLEESKLQNKSLSNNHKIINKLENLVVNENNLDFVLVD